MAGRSEEVAALFDRNAAHYDAVNSVITFGQDGCWRRAAAGRAVARARDVAGPVAPHVLDACGGTGLIALELARRGAQVTLADVSTGMLGVARRRLRAHGLTLEIVCADLASEAAAALPGAPFAAVTLAFGLRYVAHPAVLLRNLATALAPGAALVVLEAVVPAGGLVSPAARAYFFEVAPRVATVLAGRGELYRELTTTVRALGTLADLLAVVEEAGLQPREVRSFARGVVAGLVLTRREAPPVG